MSDLPFSRLQALNAELTRRIEAVRAGKLRTLSHKKLTEMVLGHLIISQKCLEVTLEFAAQLEAGRGQLERAAAILEDQPEGVPPL